MKRSFDSIAQRALYGYLFTFADAPADPAQAQLHGRMKALWEALYADPALLGLPVDADEAYEWFKVNNTNPELNEKYLKVFKGIFQFWQLMFVLARHGEVQDGALYLSKEELNARKTSWQAGAVAPLAKAGFELVRDKSGVSLRAEEYLLSSLQALALASEENAIKADGEDKFRLPCRTLFDFARWINIFATGAHTKAAIEAVKARYAELNGVLGLVVKEKKEDFPEEALKLLEARKEAKKAKDWAKADAIRDELKAMGFAVEDTKDGAKLKKL